jgi:hypothetical protein
MAAAAAPEDTTQRRLRSSTEVLVTVDDVYNYEGSAAYVEEAASGRVNWRLWRKGRSEIPNAAYVKLPKDDTKLKNHLDIICNHIRRGFIWILYLANHALDKKADRFTKENAQMLMDAAASPTSRLYCLNLGELFNTDEGAQEVIIKEIGKTTIVSIWTYEANFNVSVKELGSFLFDGARIPDNETNSQWESRKQLLKDYKLLTRKVLPPAESTAELQWLQQAHLKSDERQWITANIDAPVKELKFGMTTSWPVRSQLWYNLLNLLGPNLEERLKFYLKLRYFTYNKGKASDEVYKLSRKGRSPGPSIAGVKAWIAMQRRLQPFSSEPLQKAFQILDAFSASIKSMDVSPEKVTLVQRSAEYERYRDSLGKPKKRSRQKFYKNYIPDSQDAVYASYVTIDGKEQGGLFALKDIYPGECLGRYNVVKQLAEHVGGLARVGRVASQAFAMNKSRKDYTFVKKIEGVDTSFNGNPSLLLGETFSVLFKGEAQRKKVHKIVNSNLDLKEKFFGNSDIDLQVPSIIRSKGNVLGFANFATLHYANAVATDDSEAYSKNTKEGYDYYLMLRAKKFIPAGQEIRFYYGKEFSFLDDVNWLQKLYQTPPWPKQPPVKMLLEPGFNVQRLHKDTNFHTLTFADRLHRVDNKLVNIMIDLNGDFLGTRFSNDYYDPSPDVNTFDVFQARAPAIAFSASQFHGAAWIPMPKDNDTVSRIFLIACPTDLFETDEEFKNLILEETAAVADKKDIGQLDLTFREPTEFPEPDFSDQPDPFEVRMGYELEPGLSTIPESSFMFPPTMIYCKLGEHSSTWRKDIGEALTANDYRIEDDKEDNPAFEIYVDIPEEGDEEGFNYESLAQLIGGCFKKQVKRIMVVIPVFNVLHSYNPTDILEVESLSTVRNYKFVQDLNGELGRSIHKEILAQKPNGLPKDTTRQWLEKWLGMEYNKSYRNNVLRTLGPKISIIAINIIRPKQAPSTFPKTLEIEVSNGFAFTKNALCADGTRHDIIQDWSKDVVVESVDSKTGGKVQISTSKLYGWKHKIISEEPDDWPRKKPVDHPTRRPAGGAPAPVASAAGYAKIPPVIDLTFDPKAPAAAAAPEAAAAAPPAKKQRTKGHAKPPQLNDHVRSGETILESIMDTRSNGLKHSDTVLNLKEQWLKTRTGNLKAAAFLNSLKPPTEL